MEAHGVPTTPLYIGTPWVFAYTTNFEQLLWGHPQNKMLPCATCVLIATTISFWNIIAQHMGYRCSCGSCGFTSNHNDLCMDCIFTVPHGNKWHFITMWTSTDICCPLMILCLNAPPWILQQLRSNSSSCVLSLLNLFPKYTALKKSLTAWISGKVTD